MKIASVVGARPNFVKMAPIHDAILASGNEHVIINTGQHYDYELSDIFFRDFQLPKPDFDLDVGSGSSCFQIGEILKRLEIHLAGSNFDIVLVYGDTNSTLAGAISANKCGIKLGHVEAGLRSFDITMPEEHNRILTDHLADYHSHIKQSDTRRLQQQVRREKSPSAHDSRHSVWCRCSGGCRSTSSKAAVSAATTEVHGHA